MKDKRGRDLVIFFTAYLFSAFGYEFIFFIMTLHVYDLSKSAMNVGIFTALTFIPRLFSSVMGGAADKFGKGKCFAVAAAMVGLLVFSMTFARDIKQIYMLWFLTSIFLTVIVNVRSALMAEIVSREHYTTGNALVLSLLNGAKLLAPLAGGYIVMLYSIKPLMYFTCIVYLLASVVSAYIKADSKAAGEKTSFMDNVRKGLEFMTQNRLFGFLTSVAFFWRLFLGLQLSLFVIYIKTYLAGSSSQYGIFMTVMGAGSIVGSLLGPYTAKRIDTLRFIRIGLSLHYLSFVALGICKDYYWALGIIFISYIFFYMTLVGVHSIRDLITPFEIRSSAYGSVTAVLTPAAIASMLAGGYLASRFGAAAVLMGTGIAALLSLYVILLTLGKKGGAMIETYRNEKAAGL